jgi:ADP-ribosylation factor-binding protein GGA
MVSVVSFISYLLTPHLYYLVASAPSSQPPPQQLSNSQITSLFSQNQNIPVQPPAYQPPQTLFTSPPPQQTNQTPSQPQPKADPFATLTSSSNHSRQASPFQFQQSISSLAAKPPQNPAPVPVASITKSNQDDEWDFASSLPSTSSLTLLNSGIEVAWDFSRATNGPPGIPSIEIKSKISNNTPSPITDVTFQVAVTKVRIPLSTFVQN